MTQFNFKMKNSQPLDNNNYCPMADCFSNNYY